MIDNEQKRKIVDELAKRIQRPLTCPMCQNNSFTLADGYFHNTLQSDLVTISIGGQNMPTVAIICTKCGFVSQHALGILGLLPKTNNNESNESNNQ